MEGSARSIWRDAPPFHFRIRIESFTTLLTSSFQMYESCAFVAANRWWVLVLYPNGNKLKGVEDHISVYLRCLSCLPEVILVSVTLLVFNHVKNQYLSVADLSCVDSHVMESGFDKFLPLEIFKDPSNGYLVDDSCIFGADILVMENSITPNGQCLSMMTTKPPRFKYTWKVEKISSLEPYKEYYSEKFTTRGHDWKIGLRSTDPGKFSVFLCLDDPQTLLPKSAQVLVEYVLRVVDQNNKNHVELSSTYCFKGDSKRASELPLPEVNSTSGYFVNDACILEAEVVVLGSAKDWE
ncbi:hypothetical protein ACHQM5_004751 [Ranunculus cassubicifolius]